MWAAHLGELQSFVGTLWDDLLGVQLDDSSSRRDPLVEAVGAPPTGPSCLSIIDLCCRHIPENRRTSDKSCTSDGGAGLIDHGDSSRSRRSIIRDSVSCCWHGEGTDERGE